MDPKLADTLQPLVEEYLSREEIRIELREFLETAFDGEEDVPEDGLRMVINSSETNDPLVDPSLSRVEERHDLSVEWIDTVDDKAVAFVLLSRDTLICGRRYFDVGDDHPLRLEEVSAEIAFVMQLNITIDMIRLEVVEHEIGDDMFWRKVSGW